MGVSGSGKSTLGLALAQALDWDFFDADDFHPAENISKMAAGTPLTDSDRAPWLAALNRQLTASLESNFHPILACSALKERYRAHLLNGMGGMAIIYLKGSYEQISARLRAREGHYMKESLLQSQFDALEEPGESLVLDVTMLLPEMIEAILTNFPGLKR